MKSGSRLIIGVMSGTSVDAIDAALVRVTGGEDGRYRAKVLQHVEAEWPPKLRERLLKVMAPARTTTEEICTLNFLAAREFAGAVERVLDEAGVKRERIAALASHGQTVCHLPPGKLGREVIGSTLQLGDVSVLATLTGIQTVGNFRTADMAVGGQGAPLVPFADDLLLGHPKRSRAVQNIGGIANVTFLPPLGVPRRKIIAFDTGPGNMMMDAVVARATEGRERFDKGGRMAGRGKLDEKLFAELRGHPYFAERPPKSTGREAFGEAVAEKLRRRFAKRGGVEDLLHTLARLTAWSIADAYERFLPHLSDEVILCGGGAENGVLVRMLSEELAKRGKGIRLRRIDEFGIPNKAKEAASFALLGAATLDGRAGNVPSVTGASRGVVLGVIAPGR